MRYYYPSRTFCSILEEIRALDKSKNYGSLLGLVEELQTIGNRMEAALDDAKHIEDLRDDRKKLEKEIKELETKKEKLKK